VAEARVKRLAGVGVRDVGVPEPDAPRLDLAQAGDRVDQLALPVRVDAREADDLAPSHLQRHIPDSRQPSIVPHGQVLDHEESFSRGGCMLVDAQEHVASDHHAREPCLGRALRRHRVDDLAAAERRDPVGDLEHLVQLVRDEDDRLALVFQSANDLEEFLCLLRCQHSGWLVEDEDLGAAVERLQDLHALLLPDADRLDLRQWVDREAVALGQLAHALCGRVVVEQDAPRARLGGEHDVLRHSHHGNQHEVLVHHPDALLDRGLRRAERDRFAVQRHLALVGCVEPVEDVHQRRLARAVLTEERVHLAMPQVEADIVVCDDTGEAFGDVPQLEERGLRHPARS